MNFDTDISHPMSAAKPTPDEQLQAMLAARPAELADFHAAMHALNEALRVPVEGTDPETRCYKGFDGQDLAKLQRHLQSIKTELGQDVFDTVILSMDARKRTALQAYILTKTSLARLDAPLTRSPRQHDRIKRGPSLCADPSPQGGSTWKLRSLDKDKRGTSPVRIHRKVQALLTQARKATYPNDYKHAGHTRDDQNKRKRTITRRSLSGDDILTIVPAIDYDALAYKGPTSADPAPGEQKERENHKPPQTAGPDTRPNLKTRSLSAPYGTNIPRPFKRKNRAPP